jgi:4-hydroxy-3-polyprenylbenzoate decarboxylase
MPPRPYEPSVILAVTGASGACYGRRLLEVLRQQGVPVELILTDAGRRVWAHELGQDPPSLHGAPLAGVRQHDVRDIGACIASGSSPARGMAIVPCSAGSLARIASGVCGNLVERAAEVTLKERRPLVVVPRETPCSRIQLENQLRLHDAGAVILPASPSFYGQPTTLAALVDTIVGRVLAHLGLPDAGLTPRWEGEP